MSRHTHLAIALLSAIAFVASSSTASAQELSLDVAGAFAVVGDDAYFGFADEDLASFADIGLGVEVWNGLSVVAEYRTGLERTTLFGTLESDFRTHAARLGLRYRYPLLSWLHPYVAAGVSFNWGDLDLDSGSRTYDDTAFGVGGYVLGGIAAIWYFGDPEGPDKVTFWDRLGIGITNDYGYTFGPTLAFDEVRPENAGGARPADLGEVDMSGFTWRIGLSIRYRL